MFLGTVVLRLECAIESWKKLVKNTDAWSPPWHMLNQEVLAGAQVSVSLNALVVLTHCGGEAQAWGEGETVEAAYLLSLSEHLLTVCQDFGQPGLMVGSRSSAVPLRDFHTICIAYRL